MTYRLSKLDLIRSVERLMGAAQHVCDCVPVSSVRDPGQEDGTHNLLRGLSSESGATRRRDHREEKPVRKLARKKSHFCHITKSLYLSVYFVRLFWNFYLNSVYNV